MRKAIGAWVLLLSAVGLEAEIEINPWDVISRGEVGVVVRMDSTRQAVGDLVALAALVEIDAPVTEDAALFGAHVRMLADVGGDLTAAGAVVEISGEVKGKTNTGGAVVYLDGIFTDSLEAGGGVIFVRGHVKGPVMLGAGEIFIEDGAVIEDTLRYDAGELHIAEGAVLASGSKRVIVETEEVEVTCKGEDRPKRTFGWWVLKTFVGFLFLAGAGLFLALASPVHFRKVTARVMKGPGTSALTGFIALVVALLLPIVLGLLAATIVGIGAALFFGGLYFIGFLFSGVYAGTALGRWLLSLGRKRKGKKEPHIILSMLLGTFIVAVLCGIPYYVGLGFYVISFIFGFGALLVHLWVSRKPAARGAKGRG